MSQQQQSLSFTGPTNTSFRQKGKAPPGKLIRGFIQDASLKTNISSIPGKFETVIYSKSPKKAFNSTSNRFNPLMPLDNSENPGPGSYSFLLEEAKNRTSHSVRGYGNGFVSKTNRETFVKKYLNMGPGPGSYDPSMISTKTSYSVCSFQSIDNPENHVKIEKKDKVVAIPGPGTYEPRDIGEGKENKTYYSSFVSKSDRNQYLNLKKVPGPGVYEVKRGLLEKKPFKMLGPYSSFALPSERKTNKTRILIEKLEDRGRMIKETIVPGPGFYGAQNPKEEEDGSVNPNAVFKTGIRNRFGDLTDDSKKREHKSLGPGYYPIPPGMARSEAERNEVSGCVFMSETNRTPFGEIGKRMGPNQNVPYKIPVKKSFLLNLKRKWV